MLILVSIIILGFIIALCGRGGRHDKMMMIRGNADMRGGHMMMQGAVPAQQGRWAQPPTEEQLASTSIELQ
ncbi:MAG: hypothetical protein V4686_01585 [Patescibacteria group bacterium]